MDQLQSIMYRLVEKYKRILMKKMMKMNETKEKEKEELLAVL